jgi:hypothetical protein
MLTRRTSVGEALAIIYISDELLLELDGLTDAISG